MQVQTLTETRPGALDAPTAPHCPQCGETAYPGGVCFNVGTCPDADTAASRQSTVKGAPRAWTMGGRVD